jgi:hypothetical protein
MSSFQKYKVDPAVYLEVAKIRAQKAGYDPTQLKLSQKKDYKLSYDGVNFGRHPYGDFIIYTILSKQPDAPEKYTKEYAIKKRDAYQKSHSQIKGEWRKNKYSPNMLSLKINW